MPNNQADIPEAMIDTDKLSYEIFSILESKFLFGYDDQKLWIPKQIGGESEILSPNCIDNGVSAIKNQRGKICILSIDGGGIRGIIAGKALAYLEQALKKKSGNPEARISDYFDVAAGTGTGGIFAAMLFATKDHSRPLFEAEETWRFLVEQGKRLYSSGSLLRRIFRSRELSGVVMEKALKQAFSELTLKDTLKPVLVPCFDLSSSAPLLFSRADALETDSFDFLLWEVCLGTSAELDRIGPVHMRSVDGKTRCVAVDGGLAMSNPTAAAITHVLHNKQEFPFVRGVEDILVLSLGTGQELGEPGCDPGLMKRWKTKDCARPAARISSDAAADMVDQAVAMAFGHNRSTNYVRVQPNGSVLTGSGSVGDPNSNNVKALIEFGEEMLKQKNVESVLFGGRRVGEESNWEKLEWIAAQLVQEHEKRSCRIAPTVAFKQPSRNPNS